MEAADVNNHQVTSENALVPVCDDQIADSEEESGVKVETQVSVGQVQLRECDETQLGNRNIYHGTVNVENVIEITADEELAQSATASSLSNLAAIERAAVIGANLIAEPVAAAEIIREFNENIRAHQRREGNPPDGPNLEQVPLLSQNKSRKFRNEYICLLIVVICAICVSVILVITYGKHELL
uniref:Uncharacterized protein n=1 Tax=Rhodnius prolixus TaxID=13249 RepID=T1ICP5_RHOPR